MSTDEVIAFFGDQIRVAGELNITRQAVSSWGRRPPMAKQYELEVKSEGVLKADRIIIQEQ